MIRTITLAAHDPIPGDSGRAVVVVQRFDEDDPDRASVEIILTGKPEQVVHPRQPDGTPMGLEAAVAAASQVAEQEGLDCVYVLDRLAGEREAEIVEHGGDHSVDMDGLVDTDEEDGVHGPDMRDRTHPEPAA